MAGVPLRILAISGSLRAGSSNSALLEAAARLAPPDVETRRYTGLGGLPHFDPDLEGGNLPAPVAALRLAVGRSDALLIASPEYAHGVPGSLKNALDWLVAGMEFPGKPVALLNASPRSVHADAQLREILTTMSAVLVEPASITIPLLGRGLDAAGILADPDLPTLLRTAMNRLVEAIGSSRAIPG